MNGRPGRPGSRSRDWPAKFAASRVANVRTWREGLRSPRIQKCTASGVAPRLSAITATVSRSRRPHSQALNSSTVIVGVSKKVVGITTKIITLLRHRPRTYTQKYCCDVYRNEANQKAIRSGAWAGILCRCLCHNPAIPAGIGLSNAVSLRYTR
jgi:hypothetical protein